MIIELISDVVENHYDEREPKELKLAMLDALLGEYVLIPRKNINRDVAHVLDTLHEHILLSKAEGRFVGGYYPLKTDRRWEDL